MFFEIGENFDILPGRTVIGKSFHRQFLSEGYPSREHIYPLMDNHHMSQFTNRRLLYAVTPETGEVSKQ